MKRTLAFLIAMLLVLSGLTIASAEEPITLTYWNRANDKALASLSSYGEVACVREAQRIMNINFEFIENGDFNLMLASGDYPDLVYANWKGQDIIELIEDGFLVDLTDLMEEHAPNYMALINQYPEVIPQITVDGRHYMFAFLQLDSGLRAGGPIIRRDWLEKLSLDTPVTMDDWYDVLCAFRDEDPNGNGLKDEIPLMAEQGNGLESITMWTSGFGVIQDFCMKDGAITYGPIEEGFRDYLETMQTWYAEGLIDPDFATQDRTSFSAKITGDLGGAWIGRISGTFGNYLNIRNGDGTGFDLVGTAWPMTEDGHSYNLRSNMLQMAPGNGTVITTANKHVEESMRFLDFAYGYEGNLLYNFGIEGESYTMVDGKPVYTELITNNPDGLSLANALARYSTATGSDAIKQDLNYFLQTLSLPQQQETVQIWGTSETSLLVPPFNLTGEENARLVEIMTDIETLVSEWATKTIMGQISMDEYDSYVEKIYEMGIEEAIQIKNDGYLRSIG